MLWTLAMALSVLGAVASAHAENAHPKAFGPGIERLFIIGSGSGARITEGHDIIIIGEGTATRLERGACLLVVGDGVDLGLESYGNVIVPGFDREAIRRVYARQYVLMNHGDATGISGASETLDRYLDQFREHCGGSF